MHSLKGKNSVYQRRQQRYRQGLRGSVRQIWRKADFVRKKFRQDYGAVDSTKE